MGTVGINQLLGNSAAKQHNTGVFNVTGKDDLAFGDALVAASLCPKAMLS
ncbi:MAG: hypothetical protein MJK10_09355 [Pseudomonadales bacterium]|nr:hypothetical protein [Pseudomonadales bacterium]NRA16251.1 hypothetical protein [Oceanospirillaceae bacterium]